MAIIPYRPTYRPTTNRIQSLFDDFFGTDWSWGGRLAGSDLLRTPDADVQETADEVRVTLEVPGMRPEDIEVNLENNVLTVSGEKTEERSERDDTRRWHVSERRYGRFSRSFVLPRHVEHDRVEARLENGVLEVSVPKSEQATPRRIEIGNGGGRTRIRGGKK